MSPAPQDSRVGPEPLPDGQLLAQVGVRRFSGFHWREGQVRHRPRRAGDARGGPESLSRTLSRGCLQPHLLWRWPL